MNRWNCSREMCPWIGMWKIIFCDDFSPVLHLLISFIEHMLILYIKLSNLKIETTVVIIIGTAHSCYHKMSYEHCKSKVIRRDTLKKIFTEHKSFMLPGGEERTHENFGRYITNILWGQYTVPSRYCVKEVLVPALGRQQLTSYISPLEAASATEGSSIHGHVPFGEFKPITNSLRVSRPLLHKSRQLWRAPQTPELCGVDWGNCWTHITLTISFCLMPLHSTIFLKCWSWGCQINNLQAKLCLRICVFGNSN